jgi:hypothetical protein
LNKTGISVLLGVQGTEIMDEALSRFDISKVIAPGDSDPFVF